MLQQSHPAIIRGEAPLKFISKEIFEDKIFTARDQTAK